jgi:uncharacterized SAM-binding protein YcdF (DUF218 family)
MGSTIQIQLEHSTYECRIQSDLCSCWKQQRFKKIKFAIASVGQIKFHFIGGNHRMKKRRWLFISIALTFIVLYVSHPMYLTWMFDYLVVKEKPKSADVIIVLGGELKGERTREAVRLYKHGMGKKLLFSDGTDLSWRTKAIEEMTDLAKELGVPKEAIVKETVSRSTFENAQYTLKIMKQHNWKSAIIVTTNWHTRRSQYVFEKIYQNSGIQLTYASAPDPYHKSFTNWWKDSEKQQVVLMEWAKLLIYWLKY